MTTPWTTLFEIAFRTTVVYFVLLGAIRLTGQRQLGQIAPFDFVLLLIIANAVQNAMVGPDTSLVGGLVAAGVLIGWHQVIDRLRRSSRRLGHLLAAEGIMLINRGEVLPGHLRRAGLTREELLSALREHGVGTIDDVRLAVLEPDGMISVIRDDDLVSGERPHRRIRPLRR